MYDTERFLEKQVYVLDRNAVQPKMLGVSQVVNKKLDTLTNFLGRF